WYPWRSKVVTTFDLIMNLPRSTFSTRQIDTIVWLLKENGASQVPSAKTIRDHNTALHNMCGIRTIQYDGALGHKFFVNSLADMISQEMANPRVRPYLRFYPEDAGKTVNEYWHARHWHEHADPSLVTPLAIINGLHYYVHEPFIHTSGRAFMPFRWFLHHDGTIAAHAWPLRAVGRGDETGWIVEEFWTIDIFQAEFLVPFGSWVTSQAVGSLPSARSIFGSLVDLNGSVIPWTRTNSMVGNRWRVIAGGAPVYSFPIWLYCDDVSGNQSKKWNKHNSFLFSPAGLPRVHLQQEYNVHFLCTSNLAPPLEMMDGVVQQFEAAWDTGIWAWDCVLQDRVLVIPFVAALLGDNPMQSEFACHVGQGGKYFCRICDAKGSDAAMDESGAQEEVSDPVGRDVHGHQAGASGGESSADDTQSPARGRKKRNESMQEMVDRVARFVHIGKLRTRENTLQDLNAMVVEAGQVGNLTKIKAHKTNTGIKDTFLDAFLERMYLSYKDKSGKVAKQNALDNFKHTLPENMLSPVWRIRGLDPHADTPVEILHTVLLGFVKYFWRDVVHNRLGTNVPKRELLKTRLRCLDISGLQLGQHLPGHTLVQYAGSLTGRDFRIIAQIAPYVLYDLVPAPCFDAWVSLSNLVPLIWQPAIANIDKYIERLESSIHNFIFHTICWTPRWFNKPKFHVLLHLPAHIRRFGPAILFATEAFESFNAVIRAKSVHSNRLAPSRDIATAFAHNNRVRHLLSGARHPFRDSEQSQKYSLAFKSFAYPGFGSSLLSAHAGDAGIWRQVASAVPHLLDSEGSSPIASTCTPDKKSARLYSSTETTQHFPTLSPPQSPTCTSSSMVLFNGDVSRVGHWVLFQPSTSDATPALGRVYEIITSLHAAEAQRFPQPDAVLLQRADIGTCLSPYQMPSVCPSSDWVVLHISHILCSANVQHRCHRHNCAASGSEATYQERLETGQTRPVISHNAADDQLLNTARMRDAARIDQLRVQIDPKSLDLDSAIIRGVQQEVDGRKNQRAGGGLLGRSRGGSRQGTGRQTTGGSPSQPVARSS
ncbi:hypothetical protein BC834DRAFT_833886, partial [Gloeopeniophorella convolvens]